MRANLACVMAVLAVVMVAGCSSSSPKGVVSQQVVTGTARVEALDLTMRRIVLRRPDGAVLRFKVSDEARNLSQVKVGDEVKVSFYESLAWEVKKPGEATAGAALTGEVARAKPGEKPGVVAEQKLTVTVTIERIDKAAGTVTLRTATGEVSTFKARDPKNLDRVSVGDRVEITYTEGLAVAVEPVAK